MTTILHIDSSARLGRSHSRRLSARFVEAWLARRPHDTVIRRDVGLEPPPPVTEAWIAAAFTRPERRTPEMHAALAVSDALVDELERADLIVAGVPMYNFGLPAQMKAWVDNIVRVGRTFGFDRSRQGEPYWPMLSGKRLVTLGARGDWGYGPGERLAGINHVEPHLHTVFRYIGITDAVSVAAEYDEFADERIQQSLQAAEAEIDRLVARMTAEAVAA
ncbi:MAG: FMN-dependent NADH-azoreductase [Inquilinus sp.]|uniref:FMN-dependent NADH-azoreductase n=1 Tax=Inquilinus sp. TaxID=1932117 RepID=UPI003F3C9CF6